MLEKLLRGRSRRSGSEKGGITRGSRGGTRVRSLRWRASALRSLRRTTTTLRIALSSSRRATRSNLGPPSSPLRPSTLLPPALATPLRSRTPTRSTPPLKLRRTPTRESSSGRERSKSSNSLFNNGSSGSSSSSNFSSRTNGISKKRTSGSSKGTSVFSNRPTVATPASLSPLPLNSHPSLLPPPTSTVLPSPPPQNPSSANFLVHAKPTTKPRASATTKARKGMTARSTLGNKVAKWGTSSERRSTTRKERRWPREDFRGRVSGTLPRVGVRRSKGLGSKGGLRRARIVREDNSVYPVCSSSRSGFRTLSSGNNSSNSSSDGPPPRWTHVATTPAERTSSPLLLPDPAPTSPLLTPASNPLTTPVRPPTSPSHTSPSLPLPLTPPPSLLLPPSFLTPL